MTFHKILQMLGYWACCDLLELLPGDPVLVRVEVEPGRLRLSEGDHRPVPEPAGRGEVAQPAADKARLVGRGEQHLVPAGVGEQHKVKTETEATINVLEEK